MSGGLDDVERVWRELRQREDELKWGGSFPGTGPHYTSTGRFADASSDPLTGWVGEQLGRVDRVRRALADSGPIAARMIVQTFAGIDISIIVDILVAAAKDIALYYGGAVIGGGVIGGVGGAFLGGVGAVPGAAAGMAAGGYVGGWILALLGLKCLVEDLARAIPEALRCYARGFDEAWGPARQHPQHDWLAGSRGDTSAAAFDLANGHVLLVGALLTAMMAYLTRGKGNRATLLQEIRESRRLGPKVARWLEENEDKLRRHPALQSRRHGALDGEAPPPPPPKRPREPGDDGRPGKPGRMPRHEVRCFEPNDLPQASFPEFDRQLTGQEKGINSMTVDEYLAGRDAFTSKQAVRNPNVARRARANYLEGLKESLKLRYEAEGIEPLRAIQKASDDAAAAMKTLAALHNPDMVAGGKDIIGDFGDRNINSRIGAQWNKEERLTKLDSEAKLAREHIGGYMKMNVRLVRCK